MSRKETERNQEIVSMFNSGNEVTLQQIGDKYNISRERVRQILRENNVSGGDNMKSRIQEKELKLLEKRASHMEARALRQSHGTARRYAMGCRCDECRKANTDRCKKYRIKTRETARDE